MHTVIYMMSKKHFLLATLANSLLLSEYTYISTELKCNTTVF